MIDFTIKGIEVQSGDPGDLFFEILVLLDLVGVKHEWLARNLLCRIWAEGNDDLYQSDVTRFDQLVKEAVSQFWDEVETKRQTGKGFKSDPRD